MNGGLGYPCSNANAFPKLSCPSFVIFMSASLFPATNLRCIINGEKEFVFLRKLIFEAVLLEILSHEAGMQWLLIAKLFLRWS